MHFLTRIAATLDATCKPAGGALIVQARGEGKTAAGDALTPPSIAGQRLSSYSWKLDGREVYRAAQAEWRDTAAGATKKVKTGSGTPVKVLRHVHATEAEANRAAKAALSSAARSAMSISVEIAGFEPGLLAGATTVLTGMPRAELNAEWHVGTVTHQFNSGGLNTSFNAKKGEP